MYAPLNDDDDGVIAKHPQTTDTENDQNHLPFVLPTITGEDYAPLCTHDPDEILTSSNQQTTEPILTCNERFQPARKYRDQPFLIAFAAHLVVMLFIGIKEGFQVYFYHCLSRNSVKWTLMMISLCVIALGSAVAVLFTLQHFMRTFVMTVMVLSCVCPLVFATEFIASGHWTATFLAFTCSILAGVFLTAIRARIEFATAMLTVVVSCVRQNTPLLVLAFAALVPQVLWTLFVSGAIYGTILTRRYEPAIINYIQILFCILSAFWTFQVIRNIVHVTAAGSVASWFFFADDKRPERPTHRALQRACTISLGSICFGSLLIAIVQVLRTLAVYARKQRKWPALTQLGVVVATVLEGVLSYFNKYALVYVAVYGTNFLTSAKNMGKMIRTRGFSAVLNDDISAIVLSFVCMVNALVSTSIAILIASTFGSSLSNPTLMACLWTGYGVMGVVTSVIESSIATVYVCFMEESSALRDSHLDAYNAIASAWMIMYGGDFKLTESATLSA